MKRLRGIFVRFAGSFRRRSREAGMNDELRAHFEALVERNLAAGLPPGEARAAAQRAFGGVAQIQERARDEWRSPWAEHFCQDLRYAARALRKSPAFTITAVLTLALGVGMNAALFLVYNAVALRPLPVREPDELIAIRGRNDERGPNDPRFSFADYLDYRAANQVFSGLAAHHSGWRIMRWREAADAKIDPLGEMANRGKVAVQPVSDNYFAVLGGELLLGRGFLPEEMQRPGEPDVVVLGHAFWQEELHADPAIVGKTVTLDRRGYTVVGVAAPGFLGHHPHAPAAWLPITPPATVRRDGGMLALIGRLKPGATRAQAQADLDVITRRLTEAFPARGRKTRVELEPGMKWFYIPLNAETIAVFTPLLLGFAMVLMIACTNVANLLLARGVTRQQEIGVRLALGASRGRIIRQLFTENLLLCAGGAAAGLLFAWWFLLALRPVALSHLPPEWASLTQMWEALRLGPDHRALICTAVLAIVAGVAAGLAPALHASRTGVFSALKDEGSAFGRRLSHSRLRNGLVISQVAVCLVLLSCAALLVRTLQRARAVNLGFDAARVFDIALPAAKPPTDVAARNAWWRETAATLAALPGVESVALARGGPLLGAERGEFLAPRADGQTAPAVEMRFAVVSAGLFPTFGVPVKHGRGFTPQETGADTRVAVVSEAAARRLWPDEDPLGKTIALRESALARVRAVGKVPAGDGAVSFTVIGVAGDVRNALSETDATFVYLPLPPDAATVGGLFLRPRDSSAAGLAQIAAAAERAGRPIEFQRRLGSVFEERMLAFVGLGWLGGLLAGLALLLAAVGLYGVMTFAVSQRTREIGIRVALGGTAQRIVGMFLRQGMRLVAIGVALGLGGSGLCLLLLTKLWFRFGPGFDAVAFAAATLLLGGVALLACWLPARRATRVDPMVALRAE